MVDDARRRAAAQVFVERIDGTDGGDLELTPDDAHHLSRVLRLRVGESVVAADGRGGWVRCTVAATAPLRLEPTSDPVLEAPASPAVAVGVPLLKGDRTDWVVQKLTEVGVDEILLLAPERAVVRWDPAKADRQTERLRRIAREAAMQCRRVSLPTVHPPVAVADVAGAAVAEPGGEPLSLVHPTVLVGPEGGWAPSELDGRVAVHLADHVLRAETAAIVAGTLLCALRSGVVR